jgi:hypothetical protein
MFTEFFFLLFCDVLSIFYVPLRAQAPELLWSPGKVGGESTTRRPEFLSSQVGNHNNR